MMWARFVAQQDLATVLRCHVAAFEALGGVPEQILYDRMRTAVLGEVDERGIVYNDKLLALAAHYGFVPKACRPYRAKTKGKVERPIRYARENFVYGREFLGDTHLDAERERWLAKANARIHATTKERPVERFDRDERHVLKPLAAQPYRSLVLVARKQRPAVTIVAPVREEVERRPLGMYDQLAGAA
jgi:transposase